ncbi:transposase, partial [bacterium]|nr:transposase [bacterium]
MDPGRRLAGRPPAAPGPPRPGRGGRPVHRHRRQCVLPGGKRGGAHTGPNPTDRGKAGCKRHALTDRHGRPLVIHTGPANQNDEARLPGLLRALPPAPTAAGAARRVRTVLADAAYGVAQGYRTTNCWLRSGLRLHRGYQEDTHAGAAADGGVRRPARPPPGHGRQAP